MTRSIIVCGGRDYANAENVDKVLTGIVAGFKVDVIVTGGAPGADALANAWAEEKGIQTRIFQAEWDRYGKSAGPIRNQLMLDESKPIAVVAFPGGTGTDDMVRRAKSKGVTVVEVKEKKA